MTKEPQAPRLIAENRKARFDYFIEERYEAGMSLEGWEVKAMRAGRAQLKEAYVYLRGGEADRKSTRLNSSHITISYAVFCLKKKKLKVSRVPMTYDPPRMQNVVRQHAFRQCPNLAMAVLQHRRAPRQRHNHLNPTRTLAEFP